MINNKRLGEWKGITPPLTFFQLNFWLGSPLRHLPIDPKLLGLTQKRKKGKKKKSCHPAIPERRERGKPPPSTEEGQPPHTGGSAEERQAASCTFPSLRVGSIGLLLPSVRIPNLLECNLFWLGDRSLIAYFVSYQI
jgi:hypothetical protein